VLGGLRGEMFERDFTEEAAETNATFSQKIRR
jgi:hypothetical protein